MLLIIAIVYRVVVDRNKKLTPKLYDQSDNESDVEEEQDDEDDDSFYNRNKYVYEF